MSTEWMEWMSQRKQKESKQQPGKAWMLLSFSPFPVRHTPHASTLPCTGLSKRNGAKLRESSAHLQPATAGHARLVLSKTVPFFLLKPVHVEKKMMTALRATDRRCSLKPLRRARLSVSPSAHPASPRKVRSADDEIPPC